MYNISVSKIFQVLVNKRRPVKSGRSRQEGELGIELGEVNHVRFSFRNSTTYTP